MAKISPISSEKSLSFEIEPRDGIRNEYIYEINKESDPQVRDILLKGLPVNLSLKRIIRESSNTSNKKSRFTKKSSQSCFSSIHNECTHFCNAIEIWQKSLKRIEAMFGSGVLSYFMLLKHLFLLNLMLISIILVFLVAPQIIQSYVLGETAMLSSLASSNTTSELNSYACSIQYNKNLTFRVESDTKAVTKFLDILQGTRWIEKNVLFYGYYYPSVLIMNNTSYNMPFAYIATLGAFFIISVIFMLQKTGHTFIKGVVLHATRNTCKYTNLVFAKWDFSLTDKANSDLKHNQIVNELWGELEDEKYLERHRIMSKSSKCCMWTKRILINFIIIVMLTCGAYLTYYVQTVSTQKTKDGSISTGSLVYIIVEFLPSITISLIGAIYPMIFKRLVKFEDYRLEIEVLLTLFRMVFVRFAALAMLLITVYVIITCDTKTYCFIGFDKCTPIECWETYVGQQFYKLMVIFFLLIPVMTFCVETPQALLAKKCSCKLAALIGQPEFDTESNVLDIIYCQLLCWLGTLFCPLLSGLTFLTLLVLFYCKKFSCIYNYQPSKQPYRAASSTIFFMVLLFISYFLSIFPIGWIIMKMQTSPGCGPFRLVNSIYDVIPVNINQWPFWSRSLFTFLGSAAFLFLCFLVLIIIIYYYSTRSKSLLKVNNLLKIQLLNEIKEKRNLLQMLSNNDAEKYNSDIKESKMLR